jgi:hypothetical protein
MSLRQASRELFNRGKERSFQRVIVPGIDKIGRDKQDIAFAELECKGPLSGFSVSGPPARAVLPSAFFRDGRPLHLPPFALDHEAHR